MPLTDKVTDVTDYVFNLVTANKAAIGIADVWYGDQGKLPRTPAVCVEPASKSRALNGAPRRTQVELNVTVIIFAGAVRDIQENRRQADDLAESVETLIHTDPDMGGLVIHSLVNSFESGYATRGDTLYRATRLNVQATSQVLLPLNGGV